MGQFTFRKKDRLKKEKDIQELFDKGSSFYLFPFKVIVLTDDSAKSHQLLISVSSKKFPRAVDRNYLKRRIRESYRLHKSKLSADSYLKIGLIYTHKEKLSFQEIFDKMVHVVSRLKKMSEAGLKQQ